MIKRIVVVAVILAALCLAIFGVRTTRVDTLRRIVGENATLGASPAEVIRFLDSRHFERTELIHPTQMNLYGHIYDGESVIVSSKSHTWQSVFQTERVEIVFVFDNNQKLTRFDLFPVYTGL